MPIKKSIDDINKTATRLLEQRHRMRNKAYIECFNCMKQEKISVRKLCHISILDTDYSRISLAQVKKQRSNTVGRKFKEEKKQDYVNMTL